MFYILECF
ncbi:uncharacterized protein FRV6_00025 [Fusarium oxysporum]|uniref:Uncharacterized protein n=1 Tax=Fusarium oxysporum TaxID=5507 RepID=A0A2H3T230_FUSOX|nr:uncharacterized protein FRV6_00025 [Fusarium oxysporum]